VLDVALPDDLGDAPRLTRSFASCLASVIEVPIAQIGVRRLDLPQAIARWRGWLAGRGLGLVPIAGAERFNWPGYWIGVIDDTEAGQVAVLMFGTPAGVVLSPADPALVGRAARDLPVRQGYVVAGFDPALSPPASRPHLRGQVVAIAVADTATGPMRLVEHADALAGRGLAGDRYAAKAGTFTPAGGSGSGYDLTLIEAEALDQLVLPAAGHLGYAEARRNVVTRGIYLNALVGRRFRIGEIECGGERLCEPCAHLERLTTKGVLRGLIHRGGLRADVLTDGRIETGAVIETID
jgi:MOSC domain-containing protein YiiM